MAKGGVPRGYQAVMPYLRVRDAAGALKFYKKAFGATENYRLRMAGQVGHAEINIGGATVMLADAQDNAKPLGLQAAKASNLHLTLYVEDVDKVVAKAVKAGAKVAQAASDQFYGDRTAQIVDPYGVLWSIHTRVQKMTPKEMQTRLNEMVRDQRRSAAARAKSPARKSTPAKRKSVKAQPAKRAAAKSTARKPVGTRRKASAARRKST